MKIVEETPFRFRIEREGAMRVPGIVFASKSLLPDEHGDMALQQVANVATLPGIVRASYAMPDVHWGYGFPIGGVAATDVDADGVISPGWCRLRHLLWGAVVGEQRGPRAAATKAPSADGSLGRCDTARCGRNGVWRLPNRRAWRMC